MVSRRPRSLKVSHMAGPLLICAFAVLLGILVDCTRIYGRRVAVLTAHELAAAATVTANELAAAATVTVNELAAAKATSKLATCSAAELSVAAPNEGIE